MTVSELMTALAVMPAHVSVEIQGTSVGVSPLSVTTLAALRERAQTEGSDYIVWAFETYPNDTVIILTQE